jgi:hypothetical protein
MVIDWTDTGDIGGLFQHLDADHSALAVAEALQLYGYTCEYTYIIQLDQGFRSVTP